MRFRPLLLLLLFLAAPLAGAATDPGARELLEPEGDRTITAGTLAVATDRIVFGTTDPGDNSVLTPGPGHDEPTWFVFNPAGEFEEGAGGVDPSVCSSQTQGIHSGDDCSTNVQRIVADETGLRVVAAGIAGSTLVLTFNPFADPIEGTKVTIEIENVIEVGHLDMDRAGTAVAVTYRVGVSWRAMHYSWDDDTVTPWDEHAPLAEAPTGMDMAPDGSAFAITAGENYYRFDGTSHEPFVHDDQFIGTGRSVAIAADTLHTSVMGTSSGRLTFHADDTADDAQMLNFKRASSAITRVAITADGSTVAYGNAAGTLGVGSYDAGSNIFQVLHEADLNAATEGLTFEDIAFDAAGDHVAALAGGDLYLFAVHGTEVHHLWTDSEPGPLVSPPTVAVSDDGQTLLVPRTDGIRVYEAIHDLNVTGDQPTLVPGQEGQLTLRFRNDGNRLAVTSLSATAPAGWTVVPDQTQVVVAPGKTVHVAVDVTPAPSAEPKTTPLTFTTKDRAGNDVEHKVPVELERVIDWAIGLREEASPTLSAEAGEPVTFRLFVENRGNTPRAAPLRLTVSDNDWDARFTKGDGTVAPGEKADLDVRVTPPVGALELEEATVTVRLDGFGEPIDLRAVVGAVFGVELEVPAGFEVVDGGSRTFNVTVRNVGNTQDSVRLGFGDLPVGWEGRFSFALTEISVKALPPGSERQVQATIQVAEGEDLGVPFVVSMHASSFGDAGNVTEQEFFVTVVEAPTPEEPDKKGPGLPLVGLLVAVGVAFVVRRR